MTTSLLQNHLNDVEKFTQSNQMKINESKLKIIHFNKSKKFDLPPEFFFSNGEVLEETKLLGLILDLDLC